MKILLCIGTLRSGGAEKNISILANFLVKKKFHVTILTFDKKFSKPFFYLDKKVEVLNLNILKKSENIFSTFNNFIIRIRLIRRIVKKAKYECFISFINTMNITMLISTMFLNLKKIISDRNNPYYSRNSFLIKLLKLFFYRLADNLVLQTKQAKEYYWFIKNKKIKIINNFFDEDLSVKKKYKLKKKIKIIVVSKIEKQKGINLIINSLAKIRNKYNFICDIYGSGSLIFDIKKNIKVNNLKFLVSIKKPVRLKKIYKNYDIYILSSYFEGYPNSLVEAMICGLPVISSECSFGPREIISNKKNGLLFKVGSVNDLTKKLEFFMNNYSSASKMGINAKNFYKPDQINKRNLSKWLNILEKK